MSYQLITFEEGGYVADVNYVYNSTTQKGTYSLLQADGYFRQSSDGTTWSAQEVYQSISNSGDFSLAYGVGRYFAAVGANAYVYNADGNSWSNDTFTYVWNNGEGDVSSFESLKFIYGSNNVALIVTDASDYSVTFSRIRTLDSFGQWGEPSSFEISGTVMSNTTQTRIVDMIPLSSGLYAFLVVEVNDPSNYHIKVCSISLSGSNYVISVLHDINCDCGFDNPDQSRMKLLQVRNSLYLISPVGIWSLKLSLLLTTNTIGQGGANKVTGVDVPNFSGENNEPAKYIQMAATDGRLLLVNTYNPGTDMDDLLYVYNPSTRVWTEADIYAASGMPRPGYVSYEQIVSAPGQVTILDGYNDLYESFNLKSWYYVKDTLIEDTNSDEVFHLSNNKLFLKGNLNGKNYLLVNEKVTKRSPNFVPKCN